MVCLKRILFNTTRLVRVVNRQPSCRNYQTIGFIPSSISVCAANDHKSGRKNKSVRERREEPSFNTIYIHICNRLWFVYASHVTAPHI